MECNNVPVVFVCLKKSTSLDDDGELPVKYGGGVDVFVQAVISYDLSGSGPRQFIADANDVEVCCIAGTI